MYSAQELKHAAEFRDEIHREALARVRAVYPNADHVVDKYPADACFQQVWDYPGAWYTMVGTPPGVGSRQALIETIVRETLDDCRKTGCVHTDDGFRAVQRRFVPRRSGRAGGLPMDDGPVGLL